MRKPSYTHVLCIFEALWRRPSTVLFIFNCNVEMYLIRSPERWSGGNFIENRWSGGTDIYAGARNAEVKMARSAGALGSSERWSAEGKGAGAPER